MYLHLLDNRFGILGEDWTDTTVVPAQSFIASSDTPMILPDAGAGPDGLFLGQLGSAQ